MSHRTLAKTAAITLSGFVVVLSTLTGSASASLAAHPQHPHAKVAVHPMAPNRHMGCRDAAPLT